MTHQKEKIPTVEDRFIFFWKQNFKHLVSQLDSIRSKVYWLSGVKERKHNWQVTTFPVIPIDGSYNMSFICAVFLTAVKKRHSRRSLFWFGLVWFGFFYHLSLLSTHLGTYSGQ